MGLESNKIQKRLNEWITLALKENSKILKIEKFNVGQSNPTYKIKYEKKSLVLRTTPKGKLLKGAHRIDREFKVMSALIRSNIPVPKMYIYCKDKSIIGTEFFLMEFIDGKKEISPLLKNYNKETRKKNIF